MSHDKIKSFPVKVGLSGALLAAVALGDNNLAIAQEGGGGTVAAV